NRVALEGRGARQADDVDAALVIASEGVAADGCRASRDARRAADMHAVVRVVGEAAAADGRRAWRGDGHAVVGVVVDGEVVKRIRPLLDADARPWETRHGQVADRTAEVGGLKTQAVSRA